MNKTLAAVALALALGPFPARAAEQDITRHPAYVDGSAILELAGEDGDIVEVSIGPGLMGAMRAGVDDATGLLSGLRGIYAYVVNLDHDAAREAGARRKVKSLEQQLSATGWERIVRVREEGDHVNVFTRPGGDGRPGSAQIVSGLVVLVLEGDESQVVFVNIIGDMDMAKLGALADTVNLPGLRDLSGDDE